MGSPQSYTLRELETRSGFDKRTIAYYIQESLLPKVGRRGRRTRYPEEFLDRLMFIRRVRDLQDAGRLRAVTLSEIRDVIASQSAEETRHVSREDVSAETLRDLFAEPDLEPSATVAAAEQMASFSMTESRMPDSNVEMLGTPERSFSLSASGRREGMASRHGPRAAIDRQSFASPPGQSATPSDSELQTLLQAVEQRARLGDERSSRTTRERLTRVPITEDILLSVRNISDDDAHLVEELAALLRRLGRLD